jgi:hypothetical protein
MCFKTKHHTEIIDIKITMAIDYILRTGMIGYHKI